MTRVRTAVWSPQTDAAGPGPGPFEVTRLAAPVSTEDFEESGDDDLAAWRAQVPEVEDVRIPSSEDGAEQPAPWLPPAEEGQPLLVVLHSWSSPYEASCGGPPVPGSAPAEECLTRSPAAHLDAAREAGLPVYIGAGLADETVPASDAARAFNQLADDADRLDGAQVDTLGSATLAPGLAADPEVATFFGPDQPEVLVARQSGPVTLVIFDGVHEMLYDPGLQWMARGAPAQG